MDQSILGHKSARSSSVCAARRESVNASGTRLAAYGYERMNAKDVHKVSLHVEINRPPDLDTK